MRFIDVAPKTTDDERAERDVPALAEQIRKAEEVSRKHGVGLLPLLDELPQWYRIVLQR